MLPGPTRPCNKGLVAKRQHVPLKHSPQSLGNHTPGRTSQQGLAKQSWLDTRQLQMGMVLVAAPIKHRCFCSTCCAALVQCCPDSYTLQRHVDTSPQSESEFTSCQHSSQGRTTAGHSPAIRRTHESTADSTLASTARYVAAHSVKRASESTDQQGHSAKPE